MKEFFKNLASGALIGIAMIIPGVSGGTIAVLLNIYDKLLGSISNLTKKFKESMTFLLPILLGAVLAFAAAYYPLKLGLEYAPLPTILLFVGLMLGSLPKLIRTGVSQGFKPFNVAGFLIPIGVLVGICFIPQLGDVNLGVTMPTWGYFVLIAIGIVGSAALVVPGISGSMCLIILGYYQPLLDCISGLKVDFFHFALVIVLFGVGLIIGFFTIAKLMKYLLSKFPRGTYWAIIGFVIGNFPAIFIQFDFTHPTITAVQIAVGIVICVVGAVLSFALTAYADKRTHPASECASECAVENKVESAGESASVSAGNSNGESANGSAVENKVESASVSAGNSNGESASECANGSAVENKVESVDPAPPAKNNKNNKEQ